MRVFVTGGTGLIGSTVVAELLGNGHTVLALARSGSSATALETAGAETIRGDLADRGTLRAGAAKADGVIHLAFANDFSSPAALAAAVAAEGGGAIHLALARSSPAAAAPSSQSRVRPTSQAAPPPRPTRCRPPGRSEVAAALSRRSWTWPLAESGARPSACRAKSTTRAGADSPAC